MFIAMKRIAFLLLFLASATALAQQPQQNAPDELAQLKESLRDVQAEEQSVYENYQMLKELRLHVVQENSPPMAQHPNGMGIYTPPPNYEDVLRAQREREDAIQLYTAGLARLAARFMELERERKALLKDIEAAQQYSGQPGEGQ